MGTHTIVPNSIEHNGNCYSIHINKRALFERIVREISKIAIHLCKAINLSARPFFPSIMVSVLVWYDLGRWSDSKNSDKSINSNKRLDSEKKSHE